MILRTPKTLFRLGLILTTILTTKGCALLAFVSQFDCSNAYKDDVYESYHYTNYKIRVNTKTPQGIRVDTSGSDVDLQEIDQLTSDLEKDLGVKIKRCGFRVKIAPDWEKHPCANVQVFPCTGPEITANCVNSSCPCRCTGIVQYPSTIITTPNLKSYKHELIHVVTHIYNHKDPVFKFE